MFTLPSAIPYKLVLGVLVSLSLLAVSWFYGYKTANANCQRIAEKAYTEAIEEAKKQGEQDKQLAEKATRQLIQKQGELNEILNREIPTVPECALDGERLSQLAEIAKRTSTD